MCTLIPEILNTDLDSHCKNCPYHEEKFDYEFRDTIGEVDIDDVISNPYIANDLELLQKHYTILLDYYYDVCRKYIMLQRKLRIIQKGIKYDEMRDKTYSE